MSQIRARDRHPPPRSPLGGIDVDVEATSHGMFESTTVGCHITLHGDGTSRIATCDQN